MAGCHAGLQKLVRDSYPSAIFIHCYAHKLNLVLQQGVKCIKVCRVFFETCNGFAAFFSRSTNRMAALDQALGKRLPSVAATRWIYSSRLVAVLRENREPLRALFRTIADDIDKWDAEIRMAATDFADKLKDFEFVFLLNLFGVILFKAEILFQILQKKIMDIGYCTKKVNDFKKDLQIFRDSFDEVWERSKSEVTTSAEESVPSKRLRLDKVKDERTSYRVTHNEIIDTLMANVTERFSDMETLTFLTLLDFENFQKFRNNSFPNEALTSLKN